MNYTNEHFKENDNWGTPPQVWKSLQHLIPPGITLFDPFYYDGQYGNDLKEVFPNNNIVHDKEIDFFHHSINYDWILSNTKDDHFTIVKYGCKLVTCSWNCTTC